MPTILLSATAAKTASSPVRSQFRVRSARWSFASSHEQFSMKRSSSSARGVFLSIFSTETDAAPTVSFSGVTAQISPRMVLIARYIAWAVVRRRIFARSFLPLKCRVSV